MCNLIKMIINDRLRNRVQDSYTCNSHSHSTLAVPFRDLVILISNPNNPISILQS
ncbi:UNVERIFIED_CONTAM: hypothetical protein FKN15_032428 [Acipenser sinensis]